MSERALWLSVIKQALDDAVMPARGFYYSPVEQQQAINFLTARSGRWADAREAAAGAAGIDPDYLRDHAEAIIEGRRSFKRGMPKSMPLRAAA